MTQEKMRKLITASVVAATTFVVFLLAVLVYQWITLGVLDTRKAKLEEENMLLQEQIEKGGDTAEYYESVMGKEWLAFQEGFIHQGD